MGTAYLVVDLVGKARIRPLHGNGSALPQGHVPGLESGGPWITGSATVWATDSDAGVHWEVNPLYHAADRAALPLPSAR